MEPIEWSDRFSVGASEMDHQHQRLIRMINALITAPESPTGSETISELLSQMTSYALEHFDAEEHLMREHDYPGLEDHVAEHLSFVEQTEGFLTATMLSVPRVPDALLGYLRTWLVDHILTKDMEYKRFIRNLGIR